MRKKSIFITGATGFVGSYLACEFLRHGYNVKLLVRNKNNDCESRIEKTLSPILNAEKYKSIKDKIEIIPGDVTYENLGIPFNLFNRLSSEVDNVFHCAALTNFDETRKREIERVNVEGTRNVLDFTLKLRQPDFHFMSTSYVCGQKEGIFYEDELDVGQKFNNIYEESKFKAEKLIKEYRKKFSIKVVIYRPAIIVGDSRTGWTSNFLGFYSLIRAVHLLVEVFKEDLRTGGKRALKAGVSYKGKELLIPLRVPAIANKSLNIVPIDYVTDVVMRIFKTKNSLSRTYHIVNPNLPTIGSIQRIICSIFNISGVRITAPKEFELTPMTSWENFFAETIKVFSPYLQRKEPIFSDKNTQEILNGTSIKCPFISERFISKLISYCLESNWGRE